MHHRMHPTPILVEDCSELLEIFLRDLEWHVDKVWRPEYEPRLCGPAVAGIIGVRAEDTQHLCCQQAVLEHASFTCGQDRRSPQRADGYYRDG